MQTFVPVDNEVTAIFLPTGCLCLTGDPLSAACGGALGDLDEWEEGEDSPGCSTLIYTVSVSSVHVRILAVAFLGERQIQNWKSNNTSEINVEKGVNIMGWNIEERPQRGESHTEYASV